MCYDVRSCGERIRNRIKVMGYKQEEFAERVHISLGHLKYILMSGNRRFSLDTLVDPVSGKLLLSCVSSGEYDSIFHQAFRYFYIDGSRLFRYASRRNAKSKILLHIDKTDLRMEL